MLRYKYPFEYELSPESLDKGTRWLTLKLKNIGEKTLAQLDVRLHSGDTSHMFVYTMGEYITFLAPNEERTLSFQVFAGTVFEGTTVVYVNTLGRKDGDYFYWESPWFNMKVGGEVAEIERLFVLTHPYTAIGKTLEVEATIKGLDKSEGLSLEFWADTPSGKYEELAKIEGKQLSAGEEATYITKITPKENGIYKVYANLYHNYRRIGRKTSTIWVRGNNTQYTSLSE